VFDCQTKLVEKKQNNTITTVKNHIRLFIILFWRNKKTIIDKKRIETKIEIERVLVSFSNI